MEYQQQKSKTPVILNDQNYNRWRRQMEEFLGTKDLWIHCIYPSRDAYENDEILEMGTSSEEIHHGSVKVKAEDELEILRKKIEELEKERKLPEAKIEGGETKEAKRSTDAESTGSSKKIRKLDLEQIEKWRHDDRRTCSYIKMYIGYKFKKYCEPEEGNHEMTAFEIWNNLRRQCQALLQSCRLTVVKEYQAMRQRDKETLLDYLGRVEIMIERLADLGKNIPEEDVVEHVLSTLRREFETIGDALLLQNQGEIKISFLAQQFMLHQSRRKEFDARKDRRPSQPEKEGYHTDAGGSGKRQALPKQQKKETRSCFKCGKQGHLSRECRSSQNVIDRYREQKEKEVQHSDTNRSKPKSKDKGSKGQNGKDNIKQKPDENSDKKKKKKKDSHIVYEDALSAEQEIEDMEYFKSYLAMRSLRKPVLRERTEHEIHTVFQQESEPDSSEESDTEAFSSAILKKTSDASLVKLVSVEKSEVEEPLTVSQGNSSSEKLDEAGDAFLAKLDSAKSNNVAEVRNVLQESNFARLERARGDSKSENFNEILANSDSSMRSEEEGTMARSSEEPDEKEVVDEIDTTEEEVESNWTTRPSERIIKNSWIMDSGCAQHMTNEPEKLTKVKNSYTTVVAALNERDRSKKICGELRINGKVKDDNTELVLENVLGVPRMRRNLCSVSQLCEANANTQVVFDADGFKLICENKVVLEGFQRNGLYYFEDSDASLEVNVIEISSKLRSWHERLGHLSISQMKILSSEIPDKEVREELNNISLRDTRIECIACDLGKKQREKFKRDKKEPVSQIGDVVYSDLSGKIIPESKGGKNYYITFTDAKSRHTTVAFLEKKNQALEKFQDYWNEINTQKGVRIKKLITDEGTEYCNKEFERFCKEKGIKHVVTPPYTPQWNGTSERLNRTIMDKARAMMKARNVHAKFWGEAVNHAVYLKNISPTQALNGKTPHLAFYGQKPEFENLRAFGCRVMYKNNGHKKKLADRSFVGIFIGIEDNKFRVWNISRDKLEWTRDITFYEKEGDDEEHAEFYQEISASEMTTSESSSKWTDTQSSEEQTTKPSSTTSRYWIPDKNDSESQQKENVSNPNLSDESGKEMSSENTLTESNSSETSSSNMSSEGDSSSEESSGSSHTEKSATSEEKEVTEESEQLEKPSEEEDTESDDEQENSEGEDESPNEPYLCAKAKVHYKFKVGKNAWKNYQGEIRKVHKNHTYDVYFYEDQTVIKYLKHRKLRVHVAEAYPLTVKFEEPCTWDEMVKSPQKNQWMQAVNAELNSLQKMNTWELVNRQEKQKVIDSKWVFKIKYKPDGSIERFKARLVARGFMQREGVDYGDTFAPVVKCETLRFLISYATQHELEMDQMDVETAFLNGELEEEVYMKSPTGLTGVPNGKVLLLKRSLYGLKQSPRCWNKKFTKSLKSAGYLQSEADNCLFISKDKLSAIAIYVDDCVIIGNRTDVDRIKKVLNSNFMMKDLGPVNKIIGIEIERTTNETKIHQAGYIRDLIAKFRMEDAKESETPILVNNNEDVSKRIHTIDQYQSLVGSLIYVSTKTRPDIAFAVHEVAKKMSEPTENDWLAAKRIVRYLKGTQSVGLVFHGNGEPIGYADASFAPKKSDSRKSIGGYTFLYGGAAITWKSKKQSIIALSSCEAELIALTEAVKEGQWLKKLFNEFKIELKLTIREDNQSTVKIAENAVFSERSKHIQVRYFFIKELVDEQQLKIEYCHTKQMTADILTKGLSKVLHDRHSRGLGLDIQ